MRGRQRAVGNVWDRTTTLLHEGVAPGMNSEPVVTLLGDFLGVRAETMLAALPFSKQILNGKENGYE